MSPGRTLELVVAEVRYSHSPRLTGNCFFTFFNSVSGAIACDGSVFGTAPVGGVARDC